MKVRRYSDCMIYLNEQVAAFSGEKASDKIGDTELNKILLKTMPNWWSKNHMCRVLTEKLLQKKDVNMFERMKISETIYKGVIEYPYLKTLI